METLIIIGAGIGGLSAAYYAHKHGFKVGVYEKHDKAGGLPGAALSVKWIVQIMEKEVLKNDL